MYQTNNFWKNYGMPAPETEYIFYSKRRWRIDYAWPDVKLAIEIEGGVYSKGRHVRPRGFVGDLEKYNMLTECGWVLLRYQPGKKKNDITVDYDQISRVYLNLKLKKLNK